MNDLERFKGICRGQDVDYVPTIGLPGASGVAFGGAWGQVHQRLLDTGMPKWVHGWSSEGGWDAKAAEPWSRFWGTLTPLVIDSWPAEPPVSAKYNRKVEGAYEILEYETGAVTRQLVDNEDMYSMPEFIKYHVRDWDSWKLYKELYTPGKVWPAERIDEYCRRFESRDRALFIRLESTWGAIRNLAGTELACTMLYDDPDFAQNMIDWQSGLRKTYLYPLVERLRPEIVQLFEDCCYKQGMLISPDHFETFCAPVYREVAELAESCGAEMVVVDTDGNITQLVPLLRKCGVNAVYPVEAKAGNDLLQLRRENPEFIFLGWLEKEVINEGNENLIEDEIKNKVPPMLQSGRYFPNIDHTLQPMCTFKNLCRFMSLLHEATGNPQGQFHEFVQKEGN